MFDLSGFGVIASHPADSRRLRAMEAGFLPGDSTSAFGFDGIPGSSPRIAAPANER